MKRSNAKVLAAAFLAAAFIVQAHATAITSVIVVPPSSLPEVAQRASQAMCLHHTNDGRTLLYLEQKNGTLLSILDVTDPSAIQSLGQVSVEAKGPYDFVRAVGSNLLVEYRDASGFAIVDLKDYKRPTLVAAPDFQYPARSEAFGHDSLLLASAPRVSPESADPTYQVVNISDSGKPAVLATIPGVHQRIERRETGTLFLLGSDGLTVVRRLGVESEYKTTLMQMTQ